MSTIKINSYIDVTTTTEAELLTKANNLVNAYDTVNESIAGEPLITKLYYISPSLGKILVAVNDADRDELGVTDNLLSNVDIANYPLVKLPAQVIDYKELIVKVGSTLSATDIANAAQSIANSTAAKSYPYKIPVVKVINYNNTDPSTIVMPGDFGSNIFAVGASDTTVITNNGDAAAGDNVINNPGFAISAAQGYVPTGTLYNGYHYENYEAANATIFIDEENDPNVDYSNWGSSTINHCIYYYDTLGPTYMEIDIPEGAIIYTRNLATTWELNGRYKIMQDGVEIPGLSLDDSARSGGQWIQTTNPMPAGRYHFEIVGHVERIDTDWYIHVPNTVTVAPI